MHHMYISQVQSSFYNYYTACKLVRFLKLLLMWVALLPMVEIVLTQQMIYKRGFRRFLSPLKGLHGENAVSYLKK